MNFAEYDLESDRDEAVENAENAGCDIIYPRNNELQIDINSDDEYDRFEAALANMPENFVKSVYETVSISGLPHRHITVQVSFGGYTDLEKIALQFMLGSDYLRESLSVLKDLYGVDKPTCFFEKSNSTMEP